MIRAQLLAYLKPCRSNTKTAVFMEMKPTGGRSQDESRIPHVDPAWAAFLQQPDGGPIMCGEVHDRGDCRASLSGPIARNRTVAKTIRILSVCSEGRQKLLIWCILRKEGLANIMPPDTDDQLVLIVLISFIRSLSYPEPRRHQNQTSWCFARHRLGRC
jgi:hypothetical protein